MLFIVDLTWSWIMFLQSHWPPETSSGEAIRCHVTIFAHLIIRPSQCWRCITEYFFTPPVHCLTGWGLRLFVVKVVDTVLFGLQAGIYLPPRRACVSSQPPHHTHLPPSPDLCQLLSGLGYLLADCCGIIEACDKPSWLYLYQFPVLLAQPRSHGPHQS